MRILPDRNGLSWNSRQGRGTDDRPRKNLRNHGLAHYSYDNQGSSKHTRTSRISPPMDSELRKDCETAYGPITERSGIRMERALRESRLETNWTSHFGTRHCTPRYGPTVHPICGRFAICYWSDTVPSGQGMKGRSRKPTTMAPGI